MQEQYRNNFGNYEEMSSPPHVIKQMKMQVIRIRQITIKIKDKIKIMKTENINYCRLHYRHLIKLFIFVSFISFVFSQNRIIYLQDTFIVLSKNPVRKILYTKDITSGALYDSNGEEFDYIIFHEPIRFDIEINSKITSLILNGRILDSVTICYKEINDKDTSTYYLMELIINRSFKYVFEIKEYTVISLKSNQIKINTHILNKIKKELIANGGLIELVFKNKSFTKEINILLKPDEKVVQTLVKDYLKRVSCKKIEKEINNLKKYDKYLNHSYIELPAEDELQEEHDKEIIGLIKKCIGNKIPINLR
ncbi:MAG: hypothetical protein OHK0036_12920 [Bacteroidia bacterium]